MTAYETKRFLLDFLYPNKCPFCNEVISFKRFYCCGCKDNLNFFSGECEPIENIAETIALFEYDDITLPFVYSIKDGGNGYAVSAAAKLLCERLSAVTNIDLITCIPSDSRRMRERGYNPPALVAKEISAISGIPCETRLLRKTRRTDLQKSLSKVERRNNIEGVYALNKKRSHVSIENKNILLVDDVRTTGATLSEAAGILRSAGAGNVYGAVVATVPTPK